jgi:DNA polymerase III subunit gamma/tau
MKLTDKYRPRVFEDLRGQEAVVRWFTAQVRSPTGKSVIIHGATAGVGKTSLARIYAQALQCENLRSTGSPCLTCKECLAFEQRESHRGFDELDCARFGRFDDVDGFLKNLAFAPIFGTWRILMLDEAQEASPKALQAMLKQLEEPPPWGVFIIVARTIDRLPRTIQSRCAAIHELKPISFEMGLLHLTKLCELENIPYELEGLSLIAEVSRGEVRDMMNRLEQVSEGGGVVTEAEVRRVLNLDYVDTIVRYIRAVLASNRQRQVSVIDEWNDEPSKKANAIEAFLVFLFTTEVLRLRRQDRIMNSILIADCEQIVAEMSARAATARMDERRFWQEVVDFWGRDGAVTDAGLIAKVIKFDAFLNIDRDSDGLASSARAR